MFIVPLHRETKNRGYFVEQAFEDLTETVASPLHDQPEMRRTKNNTFINPRVRHPHTPTEPYVHYRLIKMLGASALQKNHSRLTPCPLFFCERNADAN